MDTFKILNTEPTPEIKFDGRFDFVAPEEINLPYIPLAHVCRTLRADFLPLFMARIAFSVWFDDIYDLIGCFIFPPTVDAEMAIGQVVIEPRQQWRSTSINEKPLLLLLEAAKGISVVLKNVEIADHVEPKARDYTPQELLKALLGVDCSCFSSYARETVCSMMLDLGTGINKD